MIKDIHGIRPPVMVGMDPTLLKTGILLGAVLVLVVLLVLMIRYFMKRRKNKVLGVGEPGQISPYDSAIRALDHLATGSLHDVKAFYFDLGRIVKTYLGAAYGFNCLEMTTQELGRKVRGIGELPGSLKSEIILFQNICDPFRYAPLCPDQEQVNKDLARGRDLILAMETASLAKTEED